MDTRLLNFRNLIRLFTKGDTESLVKEYNDLFCLFLSQMVYFSDNFIIKTLMSLNCTRVSIINYSGPKAVCIEIFGVNYVSVKGLSGRTKSEWFTILNFISKKFEGTHAHGGFVLRANEIVSHVKSFVNNANPVVLTGHSMGGAIATLTSLAVDGCRVVTFGAPKTIEKDAIEVFGIKDITNYRIDTDPVTHLPPLMYKRPGKQIIKHKSLNLLKIFNNHKLYTYSDYLMPVVVYGSSAGCTSH